MFEDVFKDQRGVELIDKNLKNFIPFKPLAGSQSPAAGSQPGGAQ
jgi:hypothetical protein